MKYQIDNFKVSVVEKRTLYELIESKYNIHTFTFQILHKSIDARNKDMIYYVYRLLIDTPKYLRGKQISPYKDNHKKPKYASWNGLSPIIVGFGPAGIFAALYLARCNAKPIIIERGSKIEERVKDVEAFIEKKSLNPNSNIQFGEGGAGAFSDGKLVSNVKDGYIHFIFEELYKHGASEEILYDAMPHIGTDVLRNVVINIRKEIEALGGKFYFNHIFMNARQEKDGLKVEVQGLDPLYTQHLLLGLGHSARDTITHLYEDMKLEMEQKSFSMGVRVEHPARWINQAQYKSFADMLPPAYYKLACHHNQRGIYTFCMCPGGYVMASQSEENTIVTNGMSYSKRDHFNSNSALLVEIKPEDYNQGHVLDGMRFQERYERLAFEQAKDYRAPANLMKEFMENTIATEIRSVTSTYPHGIYFCDLNHCLPEYVVEELKYGIQTMNQKLEGFYHPDAVMVGIESRSSSPVRILRNANREANISGIYPIGEGAGYAGGITSAALDGLKTAIFITKRHNSPK